MYTKIPIFSNTFGLTVLLVPLFWLIPTSGVVAEEWRIDYEPCYQIGGSANGDACNPPNSLAWFRLPRKPDAKVDIPSNYPNGVYRVFKAEPAASGEPETFIEFDFPDVAAEREAYKKRVWQNIKRQEAERRARLSWFGRAAEDVGYAFLKLGRPLIRPQPSGPTWRERKIEEMKARGASEREIESFKSYSPSTGSRKRI